jgi:CDGSH-type Zn-finger protein
LNDGAHEIAKADGEREAKEKDDQAKAKAAKKNNKKS